MNLAVPAFEDLDHDPTFDQMRELGRVIGLLARHLMAGQPLGTADGAIEPEDRHLLPAALVVLKELKRERVLTIADVPGHLVIPPHVGRA